MARILLVEDEKSIRETLKLNLELENYEVVDLATGTKMAKAFQKQHFDLVLLDVMLPQVDGFQLCEQIRLVNMDIPIIFLTAKDTTSNKIEGLKKGADDYITKPFHLEELLLRIRILLKRSQHKTRNTVEVFEFGSNSINFRTYEATGRHGQFELTRKEAMLLKLLIGHKDEAVSREQILQAVWGYNVYPSTRTVDNFILSFRRYFEVDSKNPKFFQSVRGIGYKFTGG